MLLPCFTLLSRFVGLVWYRNGGRYSICVINDQLQFASAPRCRLSCAWHTYYIILKWIQRWMKSEVSWILLMLFLLCNILSYIYIYNCLLAVGHQCPWQARTMFCPIRGWIVANAVFCALRILQVWIFGGSCMVVCFGLLDVGCIIDLSFHEVRLPSNHGRSLSRIAWSTREPH